MNWSSKPGMMQSPADIATFRRWRRAVAAFYAVLVTIVVAAFAVWQLAWPEDRTLSAGTPPVVGMER